MQKIIFAFFAMMLFITSSQAQKAICGFDILQTKLKQNPQYLKALNKTNSVIQSKAAEIARYRSYMSNLNILPGNVFEIPVVVHVIYKAGDETPGSASNPTDAKIQEAINRLNADFSANGPGNIGAYTPMKFTLAKRAPDCSATSGINRISGSSVAGYNSDGISLPETNAPGANDSALLSLSKWSPRAYLNIWVVWKISANAEGYYVGAYTAMPVTVDYDLHLFPDDGIVIIGSEVRGNSSTLTHEAGHTMSLFHSFEGDHLGTAGCPLNSNPSAQGDYVADTDPVRNLIFANPFPSNSDPNPCNNNAPYNGSQNNIMGYGIGPLNIFTQGQSNRMMACFDAVRNGYASSQASLTPPSPSEMVKPANKIPGKNVFGTGYFVGPCNVELGDLKYNSYGNFHDGDLEYIDNSCNIGTHLSALKSYTLKVSTVVSSQRCKAWIDFNNDGAFDSTELVLNSLNPNDVDYEHIATISSDKLSSPFIMRNRLLRLRIMAEWSDSPDFTAESTLEYGQTEDFWVDINASLAVTFGSMQASYRANNLLINWQTLSETNTDYFNIEGSDDGTNFYFLQKVNSKALNGNAVSAIQYAISFNGHPVSFASVMVLIIFAFALLFYKNKFSRKLSGTALIATFILIACNKQEAKYVSQEQGLKFIRITQVDKNGIKNQSKIIKIVQE